MINSIKKNLVFDFDDTLFDTARFKKEIQNIFTKRKIKANLFEKTYQLSKRDKNYWQPKRQLDLLAKNLDSIKKRKILNEINSLFRKSKKFLFSDTIPFLRKLTTESKKSKLKMILMTYGNPAVQKIKIKNCCFNKFFHKIIIARLPGKEKELSKIIIQANKKPNEEVIFIEDRESIIDSLKRQYPKLITFHVQRRTGRYHEKSLLADFRVSDLMELNKIIRKLCKAYF